MGVVGWEYPSQKQLAWSICSQSHTVNQAHGRLYFSPPTDPHFRILSVDSRHMCVRGLKVCQICDTVINVLIWACMVCFASALYFEILWNYIYIRSYFLFTCSYFSFLIKWVKLYKYLLAFYLLVFIICWRQTTKLPCWGLMYVTHYCIVHVFRTQVPPLIIWLDDLSSCTVQNVWECQYVNVWCKSSWLFYRLWWCDLIMWPFTQHLCCPHLWLSWHLTCEPCPTPRPTRMRWEDTSSLPVLFLAVWGS